MDFLKKHYEKVVLAALLLVFLGAMFYLLTIMQQARKVSPDQLQIEKRVADYAEKFQADPKKDVYDMTKQFRETSLDWRASTPREKSPSDLSGSTYLHKDYFSDLVTIFQISRCPKCRRLIPRVFYGRNCPNAECREKLAPAAPSPTLSMILQGKAPDAALKQAEPLQTSEKDLLDEDKDGFTTIYEKTQKTDPTNGDNHPPYWHRLVLVNCEKTKLPVRFTAVSTYVVGGKTKQMFQIDINTCKLNRRTKKRTMVTETQDVMLNDEFEIPFGLGYVKDGKLQQPRKVSYKLVKVELSGAETQKKGTTYKIARLYWKSKDPKFGDLTMELNKEVHTPDSSVSLLDTGSQTLYEGFLEGDDLPIRNKKYRIRKIDVEKSVVYLSDTSKKKDPQLDEMNQEMIVTKAGKIPENQRIGYKPPEPAAAKENGTEAAAEAAPAPAASGAAAKK